MIRLSSCSALPKHLGLRRDYRSRHCRSLFSIASDSCANPRLNPTAASLSSWSRAHGSSLASGIRDHINNLMTTPFGSIQPCSQQQPSRTYATETETTEGEGKNPWKVEFTPYGAIEVTMNSNPVNCLNRKFFSDLLDTVIRLDEEYPPHMPLILRSASSKVFSAGLDLPYVSKITDMHDCMDFIDELNRCFTRLYLMHRPTIAVVADKHAIAGGLILSMCCDFQVVVTKESKAKYSLREVALGVPFPAQTFYIIEKSISDHALLKEMTLLSHTVDGAEGFQRGLFSHGVDTLAEVEEKVKQIVGSLDHEKSHDAFKQVKRLMKSIPFREWMERTDTESSNTNFANCLMKDSTREKMLETVKKA